MFDGTVGLVKRTRRWLAGAITLLCVFLALPDMTMAAPRSTAPETVSRAVNLGGGSYRVTASVFAEGTDGQVGTLASSGHEIQPNDNLVALPACTESSCPWVPPGTGTEGQFGPQTACAEDDGLCWVQVVSDETGQCTVAPVHDRGPLFIRDNWWATLGQREYDVPQGIPAAEYAADGVDFGFGAGISDAGYDIEDVYTYAAGIDLAEGTWNAIGLPTAAGISTVTVTMLWQTGTSHENACDGSTSPTGLTGTVFDGALNLRSGASTGSSVLDTMPDGAVVSLTGQSVSNFLSVNYQGTSGWASADYLDIGGPAAQAGASATVVDGSLNLRSSGSTNAGVLLVLPDGALVTLTGDAYGGFLEVTYSGTTGWAFAPYLEAAGGGGTGTATVIDGALNLRASASTNAAVLLVMPDGAQVTLLGQTSNGFSKVTYQGTTGWAYSAYLSSGGSSGETAKVIDGALNLRASASTGSAVLLVMPNGATVELLGETSNGFSKVSYQGTVGWAFSEFLSSGGGSGSGSATVIGGALNLRATASLNASVLLVLPDGAQVTLLGQTSNGFTKVRYQGTDGWAYSTYLSTGGGSSTATVIDGALNLRSSASFNASVLLVMPNGAQVTLLGQTSNGFAKVRYQGTDGWAYAIYLD